MESQFEFLNSYRHILAQTGAEAEKLLPIDPASCVLKIGKFAELLTKEIFDCERISHFNNETQAEYNQFESIRLLECNGLLPKRTADILHKIRMARNDAAHEKRNISENEAGRLLNNALELARWFNDTYSIRPYSKPVNPIQPIQTPANRQTEPNNRSAAAAATLIVVITCIIIFVIYALMRCAE